MSKHKNIIIKTTYDYDLFVMNEANPESRQPSAEMIEAFKKHGWYEHSAVRVVRDDRYPGKWLITDGHCKFIAAKFLGLPIQYVEGHKDISVAELNKAPARRWTKNTYIESYARLGSDYYVRLLAFAAANNLSLANARVVLDGRSHTRKDIIEDGRWTFDESAPHVQKALRILKAIRGNGEKPLRKFWSKYSLVCAVVQLCSYTDIDATRMASKINTFPHKLECRGDTAGYRAMLSELYDYKAPGDRCYLDSRVRESMRAERTTTAKETLAKARALKAKPA